MTNDNANTMTNKNRYLAHLTAMGLSHGLVLYLTWLFVWPHGFESNPWGEFVVWGVGIAAVFLFAVRSGLVYQRRVASRPSLWQSMSVDGPLALSIGFVLGSALLIGWIHQWVLPTVQGFLLTPIL